MFYKHLIFLFLYSQHPLTYRSSEECDVCKEFLTQIDDLVRDKTMQDKVKELLETKVCAALGGLEDSVR